MDYFELRQADNNTHELIRLVDQQVVATFYKEDVAKGILELVNAITVTLNDSTHGKVIELMNYIGDREGIFAIRKCDVIETAVNVMHNAVFKERDTSGAKS